MENFNEVLKEYTEEVWKTVERYLPSSVGSLLANSDINELNIHTEMFVDAYLDLYAAGKIVNKINLPMNHGRAVYSFAVREEKRSLLWRRSR